jgi:hypothetical protein
MANPRTAHAAWAVARGARWIFVFSDVETTLLRQTADARESAERSCVTYPLIHLPSLFFTAALTDS